MHFSSLFLSLRVPRSNLLTRDVSLYAGHGVDLGGENPLRAVVTGTASRRQGRRRETGSEGSQRQNSDSTNRNRIQGRHLG